MTTLAEILDAAPKCDACRRNQRDACWRKQRICFDYAGHVLGAAARLTPGMLQWAETHHISLIGVMEDADVTGDAWQGILNWTNGSTAEGLAVRQSAPWWELADLIR